MAVYVDALWRHAGNRRFPGRQTCHLFADDVEELHRFAERIGMQREWIQIGNKGLPHYDLNPQVRELALKEGAVALTRSASVAKWRALRGE